MYLTSTAVVLLAQHVWQLFLWCSLLGVTWELPLMVPGCLQSPVRLVRALSRPAFLLLLLVWSCWDGVVRPPVSPFRTDISFGRAVRYLKYITVQVVVFSVF
jgi:hypothetical protein